jgi:hypothetical protein
MKKGIVRNSSTGVRQRSGSIDTEGSGSADNCNTKFFKLQPSLRKEQDRSPGKMYGNVAHQDSDNPFDKILLS